jgi:hypothetical protein
VRFNGISKGLDDAQSGDRRREVGVAFIHSQIVWGADFLRFAVFAKSEREGSAGCR